MNRGNANGGTSWKKSRSILICVKFRSILSISEKGEGSDGFLETFYYED